MATVTSPVVGSIVNVPLLPDWICQANGITGRSTLLAGSESTNEPGEPAVLTTPNEPSVSKIPSTTAPVSTVTGRKMVCGVIVGASLRLVTVMLVWPVAVLNAEVPPVAATLTIIPAAPWVWSQAR